MTTNYAVDVRGVCKSFDSTMVVSNVGMQIEKGEIRGFLGPNGSGKTTFIRILCGLLTPDAGEGTCLGYDLLTQASLIKRKVGYMTQRFSLYEDLSIEENLDFIARMYALPNRRLAVNQSLEQLGLETRRKHLAGTLSGGWKQRLSLAACMIHNPELLLLDEPTAGVDPKARREFWQEVHTLSARGITVLISTHYMDEAERCHKLAYIAYGNLLSTGTADEVIQNSGLSVWVVSGPKLKDAEDVVKPLPGVEQIAAFGRVLHVAGRDARLLEKSVLTLREKGYSCELGRAGLEDVFISLMSNVKDNMS